MRKLTYSIGLLFAFVLSAQDRAAVKYAKSISAEDLKTHLTILASDKYEGRETGQRGQKLAAEYIANHFKSLGFEAPVAGSHFQTFDLFSSKINSTYFRKGEERKVGFEDFLYYSSAETMGEEYIKVLLASKESDTKAFQGMYVALALEELADYQDFVESATKAGALGVILILENEIEFKSVVSRFTPYMTRANLGMDKRDNKATKLIIVNKKLASWMYEKPYEEIRLGDQEVVVFNADYLDKPMPTENVLGFLKGSEKPEEVLVITAHYDHVGIINGEIHNGADDDGSGTVSLLEIAEAFSLAAKKGDGPKRSILFMTVTGEEKGLLGSRYYTDTNPVFPLKNTVANLNIDMVGRVDDAHNEDNGYIYLIGSDKLSTDLHKLSEKVNSAFTELNLDYTYNDDNDPNRFYYRSDHYNFAKNNIPIIFYFNGTHPDYHKPSDTVEKINFELMERRAQLVFHTGWEIVNREKRIVVDK